MAKRSSRRGLLGRLFGRRAFERGCFAVQVVINVEGDSDIRARLHQVMKETPSETPADKRKYYKALGSVLLEAEPFFEYASFSYQPDAEEAEHEFREWVSEIEAAVATEAIETGDDVDGYHRMSADKQYVVFTVVLLLSKPHPWDDGGTLRYETERGERTFDDEDEDDYTRPKIGELLDSVNYLDFATGVEADATFLMPGSEQDGFSWSDLTDEGWEHLKMLRSS